MFAIEIEPRIASKPRRPLQCPQSAPLIWIVRLGLASHTLCYADRERPNRAAKPRGASDLQVFVAITDRADAPLEQARYHGKYTRNPAVVKFDEADDGKVATYYARWASARGETGRWSLPVSMRIAA